MRLDRRIFPGLALLVSLSCGAPATPPPAARPCVDAEADALRRLRAHLHLTDEQTQFVPTPMHVDLDRDGQDDLVFTFELGSAVYTLVYAQRGACGEYLGAIDSAVSVLSTSTRGFRDLRVTRGETFQICRLGQNGYRCSGL